MSYAWIRHRDCWECQCCGISTPPEALGTTREDAPELDHIISLAAGGFHQAGNLWLLCRACNGEKSDRDPVAFLVSKLANRPTRLADAIVRLGQVLSKFEV